MTKTVCDICRREASNQYTIPIWSNFDTDGMMYSIPNYAKIQSIKIDLCEKHEKEIANLIVGLLGDRREGIKESVNVL